MLFVWHTFKLSPLLGPFLEMREVLQKAQHSQAFFVFAGLKKAKIPVRDIKYHYGG